MWYETTSWELEELSYVGTKFGDGFVRFFVSCESVPKEIGLSRHGLLIHTKIAFELIKQFYDRPPFFARSRSLDQFVTPPKTRLWVR